MDVDYLEVQINVFQGDNKLVHIRDTDEFRNQLTPHYRMFFRD